MSFKTYGIKVQRKLKKKKIDDVNQSELSVATNSTHHRGHNFATVCKNASIHNNVVVQGLKLF